MNNWREVLSSVKVGVGPGTRLIFPDGEIVSGKYHLNALKRKSELWEKAKEITGYNNAEMNYAIKSGDADLYDILLNLGSIAVGILGKGYYTDSVSVKFSNPTKNALDSLMTLLPTNQNENLSLELVKKTTTLYKEMSVGDFIEKYL